MAGTIDEWTGYVTKPETSASTPDNVHYSTNLGFKLVSIPLCPDGLTLEDFGEADTNRGRVIRAFFWILKKVWY